MALQRRRQPQQDLPVAIEGDDLRHLGPAPGQGARFVKDQGIDAGEALQGRAAAKEQAHFGGAAGTDQDGRGRCQPHGAGAGHHQHADRRDKGVMQRRLGPEGQPGDEGQQRRRHHQGHEDGGDPVRQGLDGWLRPLGLLDHADDLRQHRIGAQAGGAELEDAGLVEGAADHPVARPAGHRQGLAGEHGFIDPALATLHLAVRRHPLAGADDDAIAEADRLQGEILLQTRADDPRREGA